MFGSNLLKIGKTALQGNETEKKLVSLLFDDAVQVLTTFELHQIATYTYHEASIANGYDLCEKIFEHIQQALAQRGSTLTIVKGLTVLRHVMVYGAEQALPMAKSLGRLVDQLQSYNTALQAQSSFLTRLQGGVVDQGGPVRELAAIVMQLLNNPPALQLERQQKADPGSLVPIGSQQQVAFVTDEVRFYMLQTQLKLHTQSNLAKADNGYGGGYTSKDGKSVVGAAHGLEEMIRQAKREQTKFSEEQKENPNEKAVWEAEEYILSAQRASVTEGDLLDFAAVSSAAPAPLPATDLLDFAGEGNLLGGTTIISEPVSETADLLQGLTMEAPTSVPASTMPSLLDIVEPTKPPTMSTSNHDPFSAFDSLAEPQPPMPAALPPTLPEQEAVSFNASSIRVSAMSGTIPDEDDDDNGFVMGGGMGAGLAPAPAAPPPPPPPI